MNGTANPTSGGDERQDDPHADAILPPGVRGAPATRINIYLLLRDVNRPLTYDDLVDELDVTRAHVRDNADELEAAELVGSFLAPDGTRRKMFYLREWVKQAEG